MRHFTNLVLWLIFAANFPLFACSSSTDEISTVEDFNISLSLPSQVDINKNDGTCTFSITNGNELKSSDTFIIESDKGVSYVCSLVDVEKNQFTIKVPTECSEGYYNVYIKRNNRKKQIGRTYMCWVEAINFTPDKGVTVYGVVSSAEGGVKGVVVSDGDEVTTTDANGIYQLKSKKKYNYVFISIPSGYDVPAEGVLPTFSHTLKSDANTAERVDFTLNKVSGQDTYKLFILGDMHLANRTNDLNQFKEFTNDLNSYRNAHLNEKMYAVALGDMTWDLYWYSNSFALPEYLNTVNTQLKDLQIFHTIGNHDFDYKATSDFAAGSPYRNYITPMYYSFNIGKIHFVVLDDIDCSDYDGTTSRNYHERISDEQLKWLAKDMAYVSKDTPVILSLHAPVFRPQEKGGFKVGLDSNSPQNLLNIFNGYNVHIVSGHTHVNYNLTPSESIVSGQNFYEHNTAAVCASWWWSGKLTPGIHISLDGAPGGYGIWDINGKDIQYIYKATGRDENYQFRTYDLNNVQFSMSDVPLMPSNISSSVKKEYTKYVDAYPSNSNNEVLINIWNWNPKWTVTVTDETGKTLTATKTWAYDPLHIAALSVKRFNSASLSSTPSFITEKSGHFFKVKADNADVDLTITVKDEFGHTWTETMQRPKAFSTDAYQAK